MAKPLEPHGMGGFAAAKAVADSVLYEGYILYPYRASARKNKFRWQFGLLYPPGLGERSSTRAECLVQAQGASPVAHVRARWLRAVRRDVEQAVAGGGWQAVEDAEVGGELLVAWEEGKEVVVDLAPLSLAVAGAARSGASVRMAEEREHEEARSGAGGLRARLVRHSPAVAARASAWAERVGSCYYKISAEVVNESASAGLEGAPHSELARHCLIGVHLMFSVEGGRFISVIDPPGDARPAAAACRSDGLYPVLVGDGTTVLATAIILYDFPALSPETPCDFYDATEIDEILGLRVLTLTEEEKSEARATDPRAAAVVERAEAMGPQAWARLHGIMRPSCDLPGFGPVRAGSASEERWPRNAGAGGGSEAWWSPEADASVDPSSDSICIAGTEVRRGSKVKLVPGGGADAQDMFLAGRVGTVEGVFSDVDGRYHLAVSVDGDDTTNELGWQGRHFYFRPDEVEPLGARP
jgi:hypothetical protein